MIDQLVVHDSFYNFREIWKKRNYSIIIYIRFWTFFVEVLWRKPQSESFVAIVFGGSIFSDVVTHARFLYSGVILESFWALFDL